MSDEHESAGSASNEAVEVPATDADAPGRVKRGVPLYRNGWAIALALLLVVGTGYVWASMTPATAPQASVGGEAPKDESPKAAVLAIANAAEKKDAAYLRAHIDSKSIAEALYVQLVADVGLGELPEAAKTTFVGGWDLVAQSQSTDDNWWNESDTTMTETQGSGEATVVLTRGQKTLTFGLTRRDSTWVWTSMPGWNLENADTWAEMVGGLRSTVESVTAALEATLATPPVASDSVTTYSDDGVYLVGTDLPAGTYEGIGVLGMEADWTLSSDANGEHIIVSDSSKARFYVTVKNGQYLELRNAVIQRVK